MWYWIGIIGINISPTWIYWKKGRGMDHGHHGIPQTKLTSYDETSHPTLRRKLLLSSQAGSWKHASPEKSGPWFFRRFPCPKRNQILRVPSVIKLCTCTLKLTALGGGDVPFKSAKNPALSAGLRLASCMVPGIPPFQSLHSNPRTLAMGLNVAVWKVGRVEKPEVFFWAWPGQKTNNKLPVPLTFKGENNQK